MDSVTGSAKRKRPDTGRSLGEASVWDWLIPFGFGAVALAVLFAFAATCGCVA